MRYIFNSIKDLSNLPFYFLNKKKEIILKSNLIDYKIFDAHTHLGWNYPVGKRMNLWNKSKVNYCYPSKTNIDLNRHGALDFGNKLNNKEKEIIEGIINLKKYSITYTIPNILNEMDNLNVDKSIILCLKAPLMANNTINVLNSILKSKEAKKRLLVFGSLNTRSIPKKQKIVQWSKKGMVGLKLHPLFNFFKPNAKGCYRICEQAELQNLPILFHTGLSPAAPKYLKKFVDIKDFEQLFKDFPKVTFIMGHGGGFSDWEKAIAICNKYSNTYLETSGQPPKVIGEYIKRCDNNRILYGSDWPFYPMALSLAKVLIATENNKNIRKKILATNFLKLYG